MLYETMDTLAKANASGSMRRGISMIGQSAAAAALRRMVALSAATDAPLMLTGPVGNEKRDVAATIHSQSDRSAAGFVAIHCASIDNAMLSGGLLESALGGSIFFDELSELKPDLHHQLYHLLEARNVRIISATSETAEGLKTEFELPAELYAGLSVLILPVPPIAHRKADISLLLEAHIQQLTKEKRFTFDHAAEKALCNYDWPGNLNEMRDFVMRMAKRHARQRIAALQLPPHMQVGGHIQKSFSPVSAASPSADFAPGFALQDHLAAEEVKYIIAALEQSDGIIQRAADMTGVKRTTFLAKMKKHGIERSPTGSIIS